MKVFTGLVVAALAVTSSYADETKHLRSTLDEDEPNGGHRTTLQSTDDADDATYYDSLKTSDSSASGSTAESFVAKLIGSGSGQIPLDAILYAFDNDYNAKEEDNALAKKRYKNSFSKTTKVVDGSVYVDMDKFYRHWGISNSGSGSFGDLNIKEMFGTKSGVISVDEVLDVLGIDLNADDDDDGSSKAKGKKSFAKHTQVDDSDDWLSGVPGSKRKNVNVKGVETESEDSNVESVDGNALQLESDSSDDNVNVKQRDPSKNLDKSSGQFSVDNDPKPETQGEEFGADLDESGNLGNEVNVKKPSFTKNSDEPSGKFSNGMDNKFFTQGGEDDEGYSKFDSTDDNVNVKQRDSSKTLGKSSGQFSNVKNGNLGTEDEDTDDN